MSWYERTALHIINTYSKAITAAILVLKAFADTAKRLWQFVEVSRIPQAVLRNDTMIHTLRMIQYFFQIFDVNICERHVFCDANGEGTL